MLGSLGNLGQTNRPLYTGQTDQALCTLHRPNRILASRGVLASRGSALGTGRRGALSRAASGAGVHTPKGVAWPGEPQCALRGQQPLSRNPGPRLES